VVNAGIDQDHGDNFGNALLEELRRILPQDLDRLITAALSTALAGLDESVQRLFKLGFLPILAVAEEGTCIADVIGAGYKLAAYRSSGGLHSKVGTPSCLHVCHGAATAWIAYLHKYQCIAELT
jgi:hypothetical protein